ncbi:hypothetical protein BP5796_09305 [Coleophoma crateriformis]|uniref:Uncharacterized protein n=1 Tax=Coleophoma crateriformis TaxID=565419 RepID=A0A3D8R3W8_9HELO|nr:hypothetical protein BP5796_09305 [Coleophoma crateriformis]
MRILDLVSNRKTHHYESLSEDSLSGTRTSHESQRHIQLEKAFYNSAALPWTICGFLLVALVTLALQKGPLVGIGNLGTYEEGFTTDIGALFLNLIFTPAIITFSFHPHVVDDYAEPARAAIALKKTKFYGGVQIDGGGKYSLNLNPNSTNFFAPPSPEVDEAWLKEMLIEGSYGFVRLTPEEISNSGLEMLDEDLVDGKYFIQ